VLILDMIEVLPPLGKCKYDAWRILPVKCYINNFVRLWSCIRNINSCYYFYVSVHLLCSPVIVCTHTQDTTNQEASMCTPKQGHTDAMDNTDDVANDHFDDDREFTDDEGDFVMMTPKGTMLQKRAGESAATKVCFTRSMLNMIGDRLHNVPKNC
jgi:hypothetical protein